jgi:hypothetical protein
MGARMFASQRVPDVFAPNTAEFVAAAGSASSIPRSMGLPEVVKKHFQHQLYSMYIIEGCCNRCAMAKLVTQYAVAESG